MDTRFSIALHLLILISEASNPLSSAQMAQSVGTNASFVRKVLGSLKNAGIIVSKRGAAGYTLARDPSDLTLFDIYKAVYGTDDVDLFPMHRNPNDECLVGRYIHPTLSNAFGHVMADTKRKMQSMTVAQCIDDMKHQAHHDGAL